MIEDGLATLFSAVATVVSGVFAVTLLRRWTARGSRPLLYWGLSLAMFFVASLMLLLGVVGGWTGTRFRTFYLFGAVLNVPWLAMGSVVVNAPNRAVSRTTGGLTLGVAALLGWALAAGSSVPLLAPGVVLAVLWGLAQLVGDPDGVRAGSTVVLGLFTLAGVVGVLSAGLVAPLPATGLPEGSDLFPALVRGLAVGGNAVGASIVVLGALASVAHLAWGSSGPRTRRQLRETGRRAPVEAAAGFVLRGTRAVRAASVSHLAGGNLMIALGVLIAAAGGAFSFLGETAGHAVGLGLGVVVMYLGFVRTTRPVARAVTGGPDAPAGGDPPAEPREPSWR